MRPKKLSRQELLIRHNAEVMECHKCPGLNIPQQTMAAPGCGNIDAVVFVVGQSLHAYNSNTPDRQIPFVSDKPGDSGILLYKALDKAGITYAKRNLYVSNVLLCHPPRNRPSTPKEVASCKHFLEFEIGIVEPKVFVLLGTDARVWFGVKRPENGRFVSWRDCCLEFYQKKKPTPVVVGCHPSYIVRFGENYVETYINQLSECVKEAMSSLGV